jgi:hypothetical protein
MTEKLNEDLAEAVSRAGRPLEIQDAAGRVYFVMTSEQFRKYVYDDSELTADEMLAAAASGLDDSECWGAPGMEVASLELP